MRGLGFFVVPEDFEFGEVKKPPEVAPPILSRGDFRLKRDIERRLDARSSDTAILGTGGDIGGRFDKFSKDVDGLS